MRQTQERAANAAATNQPGHAGQTYLVGELVYLRGMEVDDGKYVTSWRDSPFPVSTERGEHIITEDLAKEHEARKTTLAIARKADDRVVGAVSCHFGNPAVFVTIHIDPLLRDAGALKADTIAIVMPWLIDEHHAPVAKMDLGADEADALVAAARTGMRQTARFREALLRQGRRVDLLSVELLNAGWMARLGDPADTPLARTGTGQPRPVPAKGLLEGDPPAHAVMVGQRVYLRPFQKADTEVIAHASMRENEVFWDTGRWPRSAASKGHLFFENEGKERIPRDFGFAVCLRENDEYLGSVGLFDLDPVNRFGETGSEIVKPEYRGGGYGSEAKQLLLEYCFDRLGLHMVRSFVLFPNTRSAAALRKQGYSEAGRMHWDYPLDGDFGNFVVFDLLAREWRALPRAEHQIAGRGERNKP